MVKTIRTKTWHLWMPTLPIDSALAVSSFTPAMELYEDVYGAKPIALVYCPELHFVVKEILFGGDDIERWEWQVLHGDQWGLVGKEGIAMFGVTEAWT